MILFDAGVSYISLSEDLPALTEPAMLDARGFSGGFCGGGGKVTIDADDNASRIFELSAGSSTVCGFALGDSDVGILINSADNIVKGNRIGISNLGLAFGNDEAGVRITGVGASGNTIGGDTAGERNIVSDNVGPGALTPSGIEILGAPQNKIQGNWIGVGVDGTSDHGNEGNGILVEAAAATRIGGVGANEAGNVIAGNNEDGILIEQDSGNGVIAGNTLGLGSDGATAVNNGGDGIEVASGSSNTTIGGATAIGERNVIGSNSGVGVNISGTSSQNKLLGNVIGLAADGSAERGNGGSGVVVFGPDNEIGGADGSADATTAGARNVISSGTRGVLVSGTAGDRTLIRGNFIGTDDGGAVAKGNSTAGIEISGGGTGNAIGGPDPDQGNVIAATTGGPGVAIDGSPQADVLNNKIGTDRTGTGGLGNDGAGVELLGSATGAEIGRAGEGNLVSGNGSAGVSIADHGTQLNPVLGNKIGTDAAGTGSIANLGGGVRIESGADLNEVGGPGAGEGNLISGNRKILGGGEPGVTITGVGTTGNKLFGNRIGTSADGTSGNANNGAGVRIADGATASVVGGDASGEGNLISGASDPDGANPDPPGVEITDAATTGTKLLGNLIGTNSAGLDAIANQGAGVRIDGSPSNEIGGSAPGEGNVIAGNEDGGVEITGAGAAANKIRGNTVGLGSDGDTAIGNGIGADGIYVSVGVPDTQIGGADATFDFVGPRNLISGHEGAGVDSFGAIRTKIQGSTIGTDVTGTLDRGNGEGVALGGEPLVPAIDTDGRIGGPGALGNLISGNHTGINLDDVSGSTVEGNAVGVDATGAPLANAGEGVRVRGAEDVVIGSPGAGNEIAHSGQDGVSISEPAPGGKRTTGITVSANSIHSNGSAVDDLAIDLSQVSGVAGSGVDLNDAGDGDDGPNHVQNFPALDSADTTGVVHGSLNSTADTDFRIEFFANESCDDAGFGEGQTYLGAKEVTTVGNDAAFIAALDSPPSVDQVVTATATDTDPGSPNQGDTSEFSECVGVDPVAPQVSTRPATAIEQTTATLHGNINANGDQTTYHFEYGETAAYGMSAPVSEDGDAGSEVRAIELVQENLVGLTPETTYHYRLVAENGGGVVEGDDVTFTTLAEPPPPPPAPPTPPPPAADLAIALNVDAAGRQRVKRVRLRIGCGAEACTGRIGGAASVPRNKRGGRAQAAGKRAKAKVVGTPFFAPAFGTATVQIRFAKHKKTLKRLRRLLKPKRARRKAKLNVVVTAGDSAGNLARRNLTVKLKP